MRKTWPFPALMLGLLLTPDRVLAEDDGFVSLFNGKDLTGWTVEGDAKFVVEDGLMKLTGGFGWLRSDARYNDFELHVDQGFAKVYASSPTAYVGLVDEAQGLHRFTDEKAVILSFISEQIDDWYTHLLDKGLEMKDEIADAERIPVRAFVTYDIARYFVEFDRFLPHELNSKILRYLRE